MAFPFDFGFIPRTEGGDGDPLDVLVLMDEPTFPGCIVPSRIIGLLEARQTSGNKSERNDRYLAIADSSTVHEDVKGLSDLPANILKEVERFFIAYNETEGKQFKLLGVHGRTAALKRLHRELKA
jgi:inorganic pyrophosphatase